MAGRPGNQTVNMRSKIRLRKPVSIREKVREVIRNDIYQGRIQEGSRLVEARLAEQINTSRTPVREALHMLEMEGLLEAVPRVGYRVKPIRWEELAALCEIRSVNETLAAGWAMERMSQKEFGMLEKCLELSEKCAGAGNSKGYWKQDAKFHESIARFSGSRHLLTLCRRLRCHMLRCLLQTLRFEEGAFHRVVSRSCRGHRRILDAMQQKNREGVEKAIHLHLADTRKDILRYSSGDDKSG